jgi:frataxin-like iron-binding protein CyaY
MVETFVSNKIKDLAKKLENNIQKQGSFKESDGINLKLKVEDGLFIIINSQKISKFYKKKPKKIEFTD